MIDKNTDFFKIEDHFKETEHIQSIPIFENHLPNVPRFTIAIPTYKRAKYLKEALDSAINQETTEAYEIIVVDNNPERDDETEQLMNEYSSLPNLSYYKNSENIGMVGNWNRLYTLSRTEWVIMLHDDDKINKNFISYHLKIITNDRHIDFIFPSWYTYHPYENNESYYYKIKINSFIVGNIVGPPIGMIARRSSIINLGGFRTYLYPSIDMDLYIRAIHNKYNCIKVNGPSSAWYRIEVNESLKQDTALGFLENHIEVETILIKQLNILKARFYRECIKELRPIQFRQWIRMVKGNNTELIRMQKIYQTKSNLFSRICYKLYKFFSDKQIRMSLKNF